MLNADAHRVIESNRAFRRNINLSRGEDDSREVRSASCMSGRSGSCITCSASARRGDKLILFLGNNEQFIDGFWPRFSAASCRAGGAGISGRASLQAAAHRAPARQPSCTPSAARSSASAASRRRRARVPCSKGCVRASWWTTSTTSRAPAAYSARQPDDTPSSSFLRLHQRPKGVVLTSREHHRQLARCDRSGRIPTSTTSACRGCRSPRHGPHRFSPGHDRQPGALAPHAHGTVIAAHCVAHARVQGARHHPVLAELRLQTLSKVLGSGRWRDWTCRRALHFNGAEPISVDCAMSPHPARAREARAQRHVPVYGLAEPRGGSPRVGAPLRTAHAHRTA